MRLTRIHVDLPLASGMRLALPTDAANHLLRVLRLRPGDACVLFNGDGRDYHATVLDGDRREANVAVGEAVDTDNESPLRLVLLQSIARGEKMDWILQKATELGVAGFLPVSSERSEVRLDPARADKRRAHWCNVVTAACEQSGRAVLPPVAALQPMAAALAALPEAQHHLWLDPDAEDRIAGLTMPADATVVLAVGPEGGWSPADREQLSRAGFTGVRLGPRVLRTETAGVAAIAALQSRFGDW
ncbi:MAG: 16S rRNA (uracil(1498)-N(3))-methyltransferase [Pseudoxanthomonas suwonensis]|nr:16S rRNA (uracil(1498)-N(3))-methyltransferase [Pseudoxanthomonas suwonensis]